MSTTIMSSGISKATKILAVEELKDLNVRSNWQGLVRLTGHLTIMGTSGYFWSHNLNSWLIALPMLVVYGFSLAAMFALVHECVHRTAFANNRLNDAIAWIAGVLSGYNSTYYRRYHKWHHRYTQIEGKDPELEDPKPANFREYLREISGFNWWNGKIKTFYRLVTGKLDNCPYITENAKAEVVLSARLQLAVYAGAIAVSLLFHQPWFIIYWLLPLAVGQPILRAILLAEHTGCSNDNNSSTNTRTTLTWFPIKFLMWNMPFHAEHHLYPSIPFHALPQAHQQLKEHFKVIDKGYIRVNQNIVNSFL
ncbi:fatty acid desaturase family protein [Myxosarcina sp. GI1]|uniref:fatty acid desaturase family protein n=1 Tax=Myxosarcina sp. GI1 TaxID=1541065 RepID=UPI00055FE5A6|nr:fatty acid desaturase family protein [Myxosarcina sp. GI1]